MRCFRGLPVILCLLATLYPGQPQAASIEPQSYRRAFAALDAGHPDIAWAAGLHGHDRVLNKVLQGYYLAAPGNNASFAEISAFVADNPDWPNLKDILAIAEQKMPDGADSATVIHWFDAHPPVTLAGFYRYIDTLNAVGRPDTAARLVHDRWVDGDFNGEEMTAFRARFGSQINDDSDAARLDRLLWDSDATGARRMYSFVDERQKQVAEARISLASQRSDAESLFSRVSNSDDPGLLYERLRWLERGGQDDDAVDILDRAPDNPPHPDAWWNERQIEIRRAIEKHDYSLAYRLASRHGQLPDKTLVQAEFLAGWLALRFVNYPQEAQAHFTKLCEAATTPISRARGFYWLGRTLEVLNDKVGAEQAYEAAAVFNITYYGQLATTRIYAQPMIDAKPEAAIPSMVRQKFFARDNIAAVQRLVAVGEHDRAHSFFRAAVNGADQRSDFVLLADLATQIRRPDYAIEAAKAADQKNILVQTSGYPLLQCRVPTEPEPAFTHAVVRQESSFNPDAESPAGAKGLMQLMPHTAKAVAKELKVNFKPGRLENPEYNVKLGSAFIQDQIEHFDGSYILALAGYNAGPRRVREWMEQIGDPRDPHVDPIDWIELIPVAETRNYVQRIIEGLQVYRARLNGGRANLLILKDLKK